MKKIIHTLLLSIILVSVGISQDAIRYQGVAFDTNGAVVQNMDIAVLLSILKDEPGGLFSYIERHEVSTSPSGAFELNIGQGEEVAGSYADVPWNLGSFFLEVAVDLDGGTDYRLAGTTEFLSVPYAQYAPTARHGPIGDQGPPGATGATGATGAQGTQGENGTGGFPGAIGPIGPTGPKGPQGVQGPRGMDAPLGGATGPMGSKGPTGPPGINGGPIGPPGPTGMPGGQGPVGPIGPTGPEGPVGGTEGPPGPDGDPGIQGDPNGPTGDQGDPGPMGPDGPPGVTGPDGPAGEDGRGLQVMLSTVPSNPFIHAIYLDSGANRADGEPGFRYFDGTEWIDLY